MPAGIATPTPLQPQKFELVNEVQLFNGLGAPANAAYLQDANGVIWQLTVDFSGRLVTTPNSNQPPQILILRVVNIINAWQVGVGTDGRLTTTLVPWNIAYPTQYLLTDVFNTVAYYLGVI